MRFVRNQETAWPFDPTDFDASAPARRCGCGYMCSRVIGTAFDLPGANTTWKS